jgi:hypothetical protein
MTVQVKGVDWAAVTGELDAHGAAVLKGLISAGECRALTALYEEDHRFRSRVIMARHGFGSGEYKYFAYPLPDLVTKLRAMLYPHLAATANRWSLALGGKNSFPADLESWLERCHRGGQTRPTPLLLKYAEGDFNCLHQDLYGALVFPLQVAILLSDPDRDFTGGEFALTEQRPRAQSRVEVVALAQGDAVVFPVHHRPIKGTRGYYRVAMRHGVSRLKSGNRMTLGIIFHDAK